MEPSTIMVHLRKRGVVVHHVARMPSPPGRGTVVVFLEGTLAQHEEARAAARQLPGVLAVTFSGHTRSIMFVTSSASCRPS